jgi:hypothetical protein
MSQVKIIACGDSVMWGQGLDDAQKIHRVFMDLTAPERSPVLLDFTARSGAVIDAEPNTAKARAPASREVPFSEPTILQQIDGVSQSNCRQATLLILNGGINDVNFRTIINPTSSLEELDEMVRDACYSKMFRLLLRASQRAPNATIAVVGYYRMLSALSTELVLPPFLLMTNAFVAAGGITLSASSLENIEFFYRRQLHWLRRSVHDANGARSSGTGEIIFVNPAFGPANAMFTPDALLYSVADDPVFEERKSACEAFFPDALDEMATCTVASVGHPNQAGAHRIAEVLNQRFLERQSISLRARCVGLSPDSGNFSVRRMFSRYNLASRSVRACVAHTSIDVVSLRIRTRDRPGAAFEGTDGRVFVRFGSREFEFTDYLLRNQLEPGDTDDYTFDPAEGDPTRRLPLREIVEVTLRLAGFDGWRPEHLSLCLNGIEVLDVEIDEELDTDNPTWTAPNFPFA